MNSQSWRSNAKRRCSFSSAQSTGAASDPGCARRADGITTDDETLVQQVYRALDGVEPLRVSGSPIRAQVSDGVVTLRGVVTTFPIKSQALEAAQSVRGVQQVRDELWTDSELRIRIARAQFTDPRTHRAAFGITVNVVNGLVVLVGRALTSEVAHTAEAIASSVPGVREVSNRLQVVT